jgi:DNA invertase Pin-like site-specific DNA recombinase
VPARYANSKPLQPQGKPPGLTAIYTRISDDAAGEAAGVGRQFDDCQALCDRNGWDAKEFRDNDISASRYSRKKRDAYEDMVERIRAGEIDRIVVYDVDRLYRQVIELEELIDLADTGKVTIVSLSGDLDLSTGDGRFIARILVSMAQKSSDDTSRRIRRQKAERRAQGLPVNVQRCFGWQADLMTPHPAEAAELTAMMESLVAGASLMDIAAANNERGVPTAKGGHWEADTVRDILSNPRHIGMQVHRPIVNEKTGARGPRQAVGEAAWPAIVDRALFERAQDVIAARSARYWGPRTHTRHMLSGLVRCGKCGQTMGRGGPVDARKYICNIRRDRGTGCGMSVRAERLENHMLDLLFGHVDDLELAELVNAADDDTDTETVFELNAAEARRDELRAAYATGSVTMELADYEKTLALINGHIETLNGRIRARAASVLTTWAGRPGSMAEAWPELTSSRQRAIVAAAFGEIVVLPPLPDSARNRFDPRRVKTGKPNKHG